MSADPTPVAARPRCTRAQFAVLERQDQVYPCFCTALEWSCRAGRSSPPASRRATRAPAVTSPWMSARVVRHRGSAATLRFRVPRGERVSFEDFVHGPQSFLSDDIGDFVVRPRRRLGGLSSSARGGRCLHGVTHAVAGQDHLTNTRAPADSRGRAWRRRPTAMVALIVGAERRAASASATRR